MNPRRRRRLRSLYLWHRHLGLAAALLVLVLAISGVLLNHGHALGLDRRPVASAWLLDWYGIPAPRPGPAFALAQGHALQLGETLYLDTRPLPGRHGPLRGALSLPRFTVLATDRALLLLEPDGALVERLEGPALPPGEILRLGLDAQGAVVLETRRGRYAADADFIAWRPVRAAARWSRPLDVPPPTARRLALEARGRALSQERVLLDLHSGRILGPWGPYLMDAAAVLLVLLALSGPLLWLKARLKQRAHRRAARQHPRRHPRAAQGAPREEEQGPGEGRGDAAAARPVELPERAGARR